VDAWSWLPPQTLCFLGSPVLNSTSGYPLLSCRTLMPRLLVVPRFPLFQVPPMSKFFSSDPKADQIAPDILPPFRSRTFPRNGLQFLGADTKTFSEFPLFYPPSRYCSPQAGLLRRHRTVFSLRTMSVHSIPIFFLISPRFNLRL